MKLLLVNESQSGNFANLLTQTYTHTYTYIYVYVCICGLKVKESINEFNIFIIIIWRGGGVEGNL